MTTDEQVYTGLPATDDAERERMLNLAGALADLRNEKNRLNRAERTATETLKAYLATQPDPYLWDGEHERGFVLREVGAGRWLDPSGLDPDFLWVLAEEGCLSLNVGQWDALCERAQTVPDLLDVVNAVRPHVHEKRTERLEQISELPL
jgi:hypothetical protein